MVSRTYDYNIKDNIDQAYHYVRLNKHNDINNTIKLIQTFVDDILNF